jgi:hypothetical protein
VDEHLVVKPGHEEHLRNVVDKEGRASITAAIKQGA